MENVSKALLIAGGILIAIIIISMFLSMYNRASSLARTQENQKEIEQLQEFNMGYEAYNKSIMYGVDVVTLSNKIANNNHKYADNENYQIKLYIDNDDKEVKEITMENKVGTIIYNVGGLSPDTIQDFDKKLYKCKKITYGNLGRVNGIYIVQK